MLIVGNGASNGFLHFNEVLSRVGNPDLAICGRRAAGDSRPDYAVSSNPSILFEYQQSAVGLKVITNAPHRLHKRSPSSKLGQLLTDKRVLFAPDQWPPLASGALAVWSMAAMGYGRIMLYAFDGTMANDVPDHEVERIRTWELWISRFRFSRRKAPIHARTGKVDLIRLWPEKVGWRKRRDPLRSALTRTEVLD